MRTVFISHESHSKREAVQLKGILERASDDVEFFLTSDWYSLESGEPWFSPLIDKLKAVDSLVVIVTRPEAFSNLWITLEIGVGIGSGKRPKILVYGEVSWDRSPYPLAGLQLIDTGDSNRWVNDLEHIGITRVGEQHFIDELSCAFRQRK